jgi:uncharacterized protein
MPTFFSSARQGYVLRLTVVPGAQRTQVVGLHGDRLKVRLAAPPEKGAANQELIAFLARAPNLPKNSLKLTLGGQSRTKVVTVYDMSPDLGKRLDDLIPAPK